jgi:hypothetical protein
VKTYRGPAGDERIWFDSTEIERIMEGELRRASMMPPPDQPVVNLERFIERHMKVALVQYASLEPSILGVTEFFVDNAPRISINKDLTGSALDEDDSPPGLLGRWRATLAHEAAHVLLHRTLYEFSCSNLNLFASRAAASSSKLHRCPKRAASYRTVSDWREVQANEGMAALLMPKSLFVAAARAEILRCFPGSDKIPSGQEERVAAGLAAKFKVSRQAARIRLVSLACVTPAAQRQI